MDKLFFILLEKDHSLEVYLSLLFAGVFFFLSAEDILSEDIYLLSFFLSSVGSRQLMEELI